MNRKITFAAPVIKIMKRTGVLEDFHPSKIDKMLNFAKIKLSETFKPDTEKIKEKVLNSLYSGITTDIIQQELLWATLGMVDMQNFRENENHLYLVMAGRLQLAAVYGQVAKSRGYSDFGYHKDMHALLEMGFEKGIYVKTNLDSYTKDELDVISEMINEDVDLDMTYSAVRKIVKDQYVVHHNGTPFENFQERNMIICLTMANKIKSSDEKLATVERYYRFLSKMNISPATPQYSAALPDSNLASCFTSRCPDSWDGISNLVHKFGEISRAGGALGADISDVRAMGAYIKNYKDAAKGITPFIKILNDVALAVDQLGKRAGAISIALQVYHYDLLPFLSLQDAGGDENQRAREVFPQVILSDAFYKRLYEDKPWYLFDPHEIQKKLGIRLTSVSGEAFEMAYSHIEREIEAGNIELFQKVKPLDILETIMKKFMTRGLPYVMNYDAVNDMNPNAHVGPINNVNLCVESFSPVRINEEENGTEFDHVCNLLSVNLFKCKDDDEIVESYTTCVDMLDAILDVTVPPTAESKIHNDMFRIIGIGALGMQDYLAKNSLTFESQESLTHIRGLYEKIALSVHNRSIEIAAEKGAYPAYNGSEYSKGVILNKNLEEKVVQIKATIPEEDQEWLITEWTKTYANLAKHGIRNGSLLAIAPNTSSATIQDVNGSILPCYKPAFSEKDGSNSVLKVSPLAWDPQYMWFYKDNIYVDTFKLIDFVSVIQEYTDQGISFELLHNLSDGSTTAQRLLDIVLYAREKNIKALYYQRSVFPDGNISEKSECSSCAG